MNGHTILTRVTTFPESSFARATGLTGVMALSRALMTRLLVTASVALAIVVGLLLVTLAIPLETWRTGEQPRAPLVLEPAGAPDFPDRVWVDTDAGCGEGGHTDPDDCFALLAVSADTTLEIVGISTVFGNAAIERTTAVTEELVRAIAWRGQASPPVYAGSPRGLDSNSDVPSRAAHRALRDALAAGPLTVLALGPLTNIAAALDGHPELQANLALLVAVMGRRTGHLFHPAEGAGGGMLIGHGPVFRDFNVTQDPAAVTRIIGMGPDDLGSV
jgi:inosine-uridine nucleoside N-ribohydrolase